jgi:hypothetical protein
MDISNSGALSQRLEKGHDGGLKRAFVTTHRAYPSMKLYCTVDTGYLHLAAIHGVAPHLAPYHAAHLLTFCLMLVQLATFLVRRFYLRPQRNEKRRGAQPAPPSKSVSWPSSLCINCLGGCLCHSPWRQQAKRHLGVLQVSRHRFWHGTIRVGPSLLLKALRGCRCCLPGLGRKP